jgi:hypothetical protein
MTYIKYPNQPISPLPHDRNWQTPIPIEPNWQNEAMRQNALLHSAMTGGAEAEQRAAKLELERDALLRVVTDNHVALIRAETAEENLTKAVGVIKVILATAHVDDHEGWYDALNDAQELIAELEKTE